VWLERSLSIDPEAKTRRITAFIARAVKELGKEGAILGLSRGLE